MNIIFQSIHFSANTELVSFANEKLAKLKEINTKIQKIEITLTKILYKI